MKELLENGASSDLGYSGKCDALIGRVKDLSVVIKENDQTKSYGVLIWVRKKDSASDDELYSYLSGQVAAKPHIIKHFKTTGRGAAIALVKYNDPARNINNINRFLGELADDLAAHDYVNCCYACGGTEGLGVYASGGAVVQYCEKCRKGSLVQADDEPDETTESVAGSGDEDGKADPELIAAMSAAAADAKAEEKAETVEDLLADAEDIANAAEQSDEREVISTEGDASDLSGFMVDDSEKPEDAPAPKSEIFEAAQREFEEEQRLAAQSGKEPDAALDSLMFSEKDAQKEAPAAAVPEKPADDEREHVDLGGLMYDENDAPAEEPEKSDEDERAENAKIYGLMPGSEQEVSEEGETVVTEVSASDVGSVSGEDLQVEIGEDDDGSDDVEVTELYDDSNEGEDIEIEATHSDFNEPTDTKGGEISASDTPLDDDGNVPMVNPNSDFADVKPSPVRDPHAVRAFAYGSYENANTAEEPVRFDGRPKDYKTTDPRLGDEMGSVSRDYSRQNAAATAPGAKPPKPEGFRVVSKGGDRSKPVIKKTRAKRYSDGSNAGIGIVAAVLFGIIGCGLWCGVGYIMGLMTEIDVNTSSLIISVFGFLPAAAVFVGYRIGGDCWDRKGIVIASVLTVIMDAVGLAALLITDELRQKADELGYGIPIAKAAENVANGLSGTFGDAMTKQVWVSVGVMVLTLIICILVTRKKK